MAENLVDGNGHSAEGEGNPKKQVNADGEKVDHLDGRKDEGKG
jgi:hypothetical protein